MPADKRRITPARSDHVVDKATTAGQALTDRRATRQPIAASRIQV